MEGIMQYTSPWQVHAVTTASFCFKDWQPLTEIEQLDWQRLCRCFAVFVNQRGCSAQGSRLRDWRFTVQGFGFGVEDSVHVVSACEVFGAALHDATWGSVCSIHNLHWPQCVDHGTAKTSSYKALLAVILTVCTHSWACDVTTSVLASMGKVPWRALHVYYHTTVFIGEFLIWRFGSFITDRHI